MARRYISTGSKWEALAGYSRAVVDGRDIFVSGTVGFDRATGELADGAVAQAEAAIDTIEWALGEAGATLRDIVRVRVFIPDRADVEAITRVVARRIGPAHAANTTICAALPVENAKVEIEVTARRDVASAT
ncbi:MAG: RidA family protein [Hyphomicrobiales bacterium]|nr:RidA family protein [Hyphomicrobiales bacterium]